jgi:hypothetical protein
MTRFGVLAAAAVMAAGSAFGQHVISAKAGLIHYTEGEVLLGDKAIEQKQGDFKEMKVGDRLTTREGRAEILLTPGVTLRLSENSEVVMNSNKLSDIRFEVAAGSALIEAGEISKDTNIDVVLNGATVEVRKRGVFRLDATTPPKVRVYDGELTIANAGAPMVVKEGREVLLAAVPVVEKFRKEETDSFVRWAGRRSGYLSAANMSAARYMRENNMSWQTAGWFYNPYMGMFTYLPFNGVYNNFWNHRYYSPRAVYSYNPPSMQPGGYDPNNIGSSRGPVDFGRSDIGSGGRAVYSSPSSVSSGGMSGGGAAPSTGTSSQTTGGSSRGR